MRTLRLLSCLLILAQSCPVVRAQTLVMPEIVVSARGYGSEISSTPGGVEVLEAEDIQELGSVTSLPDALDRLPGVSRSSDSPWGSELSIRGLSRDNVVLLIDGCRVNTTTDINGRFGLVNPEDVERVEVLKGPVSTLYGSGSTGGVVNIITRKGDFADQTSLSGGLATAAQSNPQGADAHARLALSMPKTWFYASGGWRDHDSYYAGGDKVHNSQYQDNTGKVAAGFRWSEESQSELQFQLYDGSEIGVPGTGAAPLPAAADVTLETERRRLIQFRHLHQPKDGLLQQTEFMVFYQRMERQPRIDNFHAGQMRSIKPEAQHESVGARLTNILEFDAHRLVLGADAWTWRMSGSRQRNLVSGAVLIDDPTPNTIQSSLGLFAEDDWGLAPDWTLNLGARLDLVTIDHGRRTLSDLPDMEAGIREDTSYGAHAGLTWDAAEDWSLTGLVATSYRTPNTLELFKDISLAGGAREIGNPDLDPERSLFAELGAHYTGARLTLDTALYANRIDDYIDSELVEEGLYRMANVSRAEIWGVEQSVEWRFLEGWSAFGSLAYTQGRDATKDEWLRFVAPLNGLVGLRQELDMGLWWEMEVDFAAEQDKVPDDLEHAEGWATLNARAGYGFELLGLKHDLTLSLTNILDDEHHNYLATSRGVELHDPGFGALLAWRVTW